VLRPAEVGDLATIRRLHALSFATLANLEHSRAQIAAHRALTETPRYETDVLRSHLMPALAPPDEIVTTAGWIEVPDEPGTARIRKVFVHPDWARRALASGLVLDAEQRTHLPPAIRGSWSAPTTTRCRSIESSATRRCERA
jgi:hypothetical protein